uniref:Uncharacterized protein n=2 Tax=Kalanchoe fedtschenkoi TaxID=63787 RepID=A0A7N0URM9_KALFE
MAAAAAGRWLLFVAVAAAVLCAGVRAQEAEEAVGSVGLDSEGLKAEIEQLKSRIHALELEKSSIALDLKHKDVIIYQKDSDIKEKSEKVVKLQSDLAAIQGKGTSDAEEKVAKAEARVADLQKQVANLEAKIGKQYKEKEAAEARAALAVQQKNELSAKLEELQKTVDLKQAKIRKTERALKAAEEEIIKIKSEANSKIEELLEAHGAWLPPWLASHLVRYQAHWDEHGKPAVDFAFQKAWEKKSEAEKWAEPHLEVVKTKWIPALKEYWLLIVAHVEPHVKAVQAKSIKAFEASKKAVTPHIIKLNENVYPYYQEAKRVTKPYIEQVASISKPHVEKVKTALKPYTEEAVKHYGNFLESASIYHSQVQAHVKQTLKKHEWTKPFATKEFEWFAASAVLALPVMILFRIFSSACSKKSKRPSKHAHHHGRRKAKRGHHG